MYSFGSEMPTQTLFGEFRSLNCKLPNHFWEKYELSISHCVLRPDNSPITLG